MLCPGGQRRKSKSVSSRAPPWPKPSSAPALPQGFRAQTSPGRRSAFSASVSVATRSLATATGSSSTGGSSPTPNLGGGGGQPRFAPASPGDENLLHIRNTSNWNYYHITPD